ncbi:hypothetical protein [Methylophilus sp. 14]|uniref:hypothetical protein n=1 Tax=Methylophilus sp. 14 TaxID=2781019 RepID=UPI00188F94F2|nr:hypothetical protein [Methylophilus sp. 14]MBF4987133.1 hypothetical protein [Methylophilus sp. 14]
MMRRGLLWAALACTLLACWWVEQAEQAPVAAVQPPQRRVSLAQALPQAVVPKRISAPQNVSIPASMTAVADEPAIDLFAVLEMPSADSAEAAMPEAVNPYTYAGRLQEDGRWTVFLTDGQQQYVLHEGDHFAEGWRVAVLDQQKVVLQHAAERFEIRLDNGVVF